MAVIPHVRLGICQFFDAPLSGVAIILNVTMRTAGDAFQYVRVHLLTLCATIFG